MDKLKEIFKVVKNDFKKNVPPLTEKINEEHHYEVWADNHGKQTFFGKVIMHTDTVEIAFYPGLDKETDWELFPGDIFKRMGDKFDIKIRDLSPELQQNIVEGINNLIDWFRTQKLLHKETEF